MKKSLHKDGNGFGKVGIVGIIVAVIAIVSLVGWSISSNKSTQTSASVAITTCNKNYHDTSLCKFAASNVNLSKQAYTAIGVTTDVQGITTNITIKSDGKGNTVINRMAGDQGLNSIQIGHTTYLQQSGTQTWIKYISGLTSGINPVSNMKLDFNQSSLPPTQRLQYKQLGTELCGSVKCYKYQIINPISPTATQYVWFNVNDYRLQHWYSKDAGGTNDFTLTYSPVSINAPSPVVNPSGSINSGGVSITPAQIQDALRQANPKVSH